MVRKQKLSAGPSRSPRPVFARRRSSSMRLLISASYTTAMHQPLERREYLMRFGAHCLAHASLQAGMAYFDLPGVGYLAYSSYCGTRFALAEPLCAAADRATLLQAALAEHSETCFV